MKTRLYFLVLIILITAMQAFAATNIKEMFEEGTGSVEIRTLYFNRTFNSSKADMEDQAIGGMFHYKTAPLKGVSFGVGFYTSNDINSDDDDDVYGNLAKGSDGSHESYTKMAEYFVQGDWFDTTIRYGAQEIVTPFVNKYDFRMSPKTYKGLAVVNRSVENLEASLYYITDFMDNNSLDYVDAGYSFNKNMDDNPLYAAGLKYSAEVSESFKIIPQAWYYTMQDGFAFTYGNVEFTGASPLGKYSVKPSYLSQKAIGSKDGGDLDTYQYGVAGNLKTHGFDISLYYAKTGDDAVSAPWGNSKVIVQQVLASTRAEEKAYAAKVGYDFTKLGATGLSFAVFYANYDTPDSGVNKSDDQSETDYDLTYKFSMPALKGLSLRARYADIDTDGGTDYVDKRLYAVYTFNFGGKAAK
ncbi:OprD family outer membrane porin [Seleniivibrio sp.]|uniref:OprD family outer membrane porin n=1 Tax=Seleniivibrio sp. TaxID=2898801 RepID=UPI0025E5BAAE|nr:OprD family outer membrane porin [Seleniivibrio sp.]MCD8553593.1 OprD family porin [Seleniivibrio sp.]